MSVGREPFGTTPAGEPVELYRLANDSGIGVAVAGWGATLVSVTAPDRDGRPAEVVLGFDALAAYLAPQPYLGATVGRYANRIAGGRFRLGSLVYRLARNEGDNHLHGGGRGFDKVPWRTQERPCLLAPDSVAFEYVSAAGEEGYPGSLRACVAYSLSPDGALQIDYAASTDAPTVVNLTNHAYFNLAGAGDVLGHRLTIGAGRYLPVDAGLIPTGELAPVLGTPFDFTEARAIGERIAEDHPQLRLAGGYDHCYALDRAQAGLAFAARLVDPHSGRGLEIRTTQPGLQFYAGNRLDGRLAGRGGRRYGPHHGLCLETQAFPDAPNQPGFPSTVLMPGETYRHSTLYRFFVSSD